MDGDMNDIFQKLNTMLEDKDMSNNLKNIINNFSSSNNQSSPQSTETQQNNHTTNNTNYSKEVASNEKNTSENSNISSFFNDSSKNQGTASSNTGSKKQGMPEFDINTILKIKSIMDSLNNTENDARSNLLLSLKPYLADHKKDKIDQYVKFLQFAKVIEILNPMGGDNTKND